MPRKQSLASKCMAPTSGFWVISRLTTFSLRSALYDIRQALSNSFSASDAVIFNGDSDGLKGAKSNQCLGRVSRPSLFNLAYNGVPGKGVREYVLPHCLTFFQPPQSCMTD